MKQQKHPDVYPVVHNTKLEWIVSTAFQGNFQKINTFLHQNPFIRAIYLELLSELNLEAFLAALGRVKCANVNTELFDMLKRESKNIADALTIESCQWHFISPNSPHFGGHILESAVNSMKYHLYQTADNSLLKFKETSK